MGQECGPASDVWAAGVMMYQLLSARYPFWDTPASSVDRLPLYQVMLAVTSNPIHMNGPEWDCVSRQAKDLVMAMLGEGTRGEVGGGRGSRGHAMQGVVRTMLGEGNGDGGQRGEKGVAMSVQGAG